MQPTATTSLSRAILYGTLAAVCLSLGKGFQKYGVDVLAEPRRVLSRENRFRFAVWCTGTAGIVASTFLLFTACAYGPVTIAAALSGVGLVALAIFSAVVLGERATRAEVAGIAAIVAGTVLTGYFQEAPALNASGAVVAPLLPSRLLGFTLLLVGASAGVIGYARRGEGRSYLGVLLGSVAGFCGGLNLVYQKGAMVHCACIDIFADVPAVLRNPYFYPFVLFGVLDFVITQLALQRGRAVSVVPSYQSFYMLVPVLGGLIAFGERLTGWQLPGLALLLAGVVLLSRFVAQESGARGRAPALG